jgi:dihydroorotase
MTTIHSELAEARDLLERLTSGSLTLRVNHKDVTRREIDVLTREIAFLEKVIARGKLPGGPFAGPRA